MIIYFQDNHWGLSRVGCKPCHCSLAGSLDNEPSCDELTGQCVCKDNVAGMKCDRCNNGFMGVDNDNGEIGPDEDNEFGCTPCFCYNHSNECRASKPGIWNFSQIYIYFKIWKWLFNFFFEKFKW